jgi:hypothetical protein
MLLITLGIIPFLGCYPLARIGEIGAIFRGYHIGFSVFSLFLASCATPRNSDGTIDACKLTKPPKEAMIENAGHLGRMYGYPDLTKVPDNYSGCQKTWLGSYNDSPANSYLFIFIQFNEGVVSRIEFPRSLSDDRVSAFCEFDKNGNLSKKSSDECKKSDFYSIKDFKARQSKGK